jgi:uncharacterized membrane protein
MNAAHLHILINHFPIIGLIFSLGIFLVAAVRKRPDLARTALVMLVVVALISIAVYLTGEPAEEIVESLPGTSETILERHEEAGLIALVALEVLGALSLLVLIAHRRPQPLPGWLLYTLLVLAVVVTGWVAWTSSIGGQITHPEARPGFDPAIATIDLEE